MLGFSPIELQTLRMGKVHFLVSAVFFSAMALADESAMRVQVVDPAKATPAATTVAPAVVGAGTTRPAFSPQNNGSLPTPINNPAPSPAASNGAPGGMPNMPGMGGSPNGGVPGDYSPSSYSASRQGPGGSGGPGGYNAATGEEAFVGSKLSCKRDGQETCTGVELKLGPLNQNPANSNKQAFIEWLKPAALFIQAQTGLPASIIIAQAALETAWGTSANFRNRNSMFGHSCWNNASQTGEAQIGPNRYAWKGDCAADRPANEGGKYLVFPNKENSLLAYLQNILRSRGRYQGVQAETQRARTGEPPGVANWTTVIKDIAASGYAADNGYMMKVGGIIQNYGLDKLNGGDCQLCVHQQRKNGTPVTGVPGTER